MDNGPVQRERRPLIPLEPNLNEDLGSPRIVRDFDERSEISLQIDRRERRDLLGLISDQEESDTQSVSSHLLDKNSNSKKTDRFSDNSDESVGLILGDSQVKILSYSWRTQHPERLSSYKEEYRSCFPVHEKSLPVLQVPSLDDMLEPMIKRVLANKTVKSWYKQKQLFSQPVKQIEKLSYSGQVASRMGFISIFYMQQAMGTLLGNLENDNASEENCQLVQDLFAMSTKFLDQMGSVGAFHHIIRRKCAATDAGINNLNDIQAKVLYLPLSKDDVFGQGLEKQLEKRKEQREQLEDLLPEFHKSNKRKLDYDIRDSWSNKQSKFAGNSTYNNYNNNYKNPSFNTNRQSSINSSNKSLQRGGFGNKDRKDKDVKTSNSGTGSCGSFRIPKKQSS
ncbi:unnamed protein product [Mytilus coruscus]|uniref:Uncharacterized protein n=1 Tax=Mytilus coruscus TaxID=42192 RepID=A0A6J8DHG0_MYTCO|nr:unnamed protein product [Mytilus coruscus]